MCIFKLCALENALAHSSHAEGLYPVCSDHVDLQTLRTWAFFCTTSAFVSTFSRNNQNFSTAYSSTTLTTSSSTSCHVMSCLSFTVWPHEGSTFKKKLRETANFPALQKVTNMCLIYPYIPPYTLIYPHMALIWASYGPHIASHTLI